MAACGSLQHIFDKPLPPENRSMLDSLSSWKPIQTMKSKSSSVDEPPSFTEIFGELHFQENPDTTASSPINLSPATSFPSTSFMTALSTSGIKELKDNNTGSNIINNINHCKSKSESNYFPTKHTRHNHSNSFSSINSDSLSICTEGLGFESSDDVEDYIENDWKQEGWRSFSKHKPLEYPLCTLKRSRTCGSHFPPPISSIGSSGKPWVCFKSYRHSGRFILKEVRVPTQEFLHACREDGRLKMQFIHSDDEIAEEEEQGHDDDGDENGGRGDGDREYDDDHDKNDDEGDDDKDKGGEENVGIICKKLN
ncbi:hypothetical protein LguiA_012493 [Lonicera macranthoides]